MTTAIHALPEVADGGDIHIPASAVLSDALAVARRNLIGLMRVPTTVMFSTIQPVIFVLMFRYVFGGAIRVPGVRYVDFLMAGIFVQTVTFASSAFVSTASMPGPLRAYANHQPVTATVNAVRALVLGGPTTGPVLTALAWMLAITVVFATLSVGRYRRAA